MVTKCLYCGKPLSFVKRLQNDRHCSEECYAQYIRKQDETAIAELTRRKSGEASRTDVEEVIAESEEPAVATSAGEPSHVPEHLALAAGTTPAEEAQDEGPEEQFARFLGLVEAERHYYQEILDRLPAGVAVCTENLSLEYGNRWFQRELQLGEGELIGTKLTGLFAQDDVLPAIQALFDQPERGEVRIRGAVGDAGRWNLTLRPLSRAPEAEDRQLLVFVERSDAAA